MIEEERRPFFGFWSSNFFLIPSLLSPLLLSSLLFSFRFVGFFYFLFLFIFSFLLWAFQSTTHGICLGKVESLLFVFLLFLEEIKLIAKTKIDLFISFFFPKDMEGSKVTPDLTNCRFFFFLFFIFVKFTDCVLDFIGI